MHPTGGAWVATHLWDHYAFTADREFLAEHAYPVLKGAAEFFVAYLVEDPTTGWLLSGPANSPENAFLYHGQAYPVCVGPTADRILIHELFTECIEASAIQVLILRCDLAYMPQSQTSIVSGGQARAASGVARGLRRGFAASPPHEASARRVPLCSDHAVRHPSWPCRRGFHRRRAPAPVATKRNSGTRPWIKLIFRALR